MKPAAIPLALVLALLTLAVSNGGEIRTWTDATGKFKLEAEFVEMRGGNVVLQPKQGPQRTIPLDRLSKQDQEFADALAKGAAEANPFAVVEGGQPRRLEADWSAAHQILLASAGDRWEVEVKPPGELAFAPRVAALPAKRDFFEGGSGTVISTIAKRGLISYSLGGRGRNKEVTSRIVLVDLESGKLLANAVTDGKWTAKAIHDDGQRLLLASGNEGEGGVLATCTAEGAKLTFLDEWLPYSNVEGGSRVVRFAEFVGDDRLVTCNEPGTVAVWDFAKREQICHFRISRTSIPAVSPDRRYVAYAGGNKMAFFNLESLEPVGLKSAPKMDFWVRGVFSPSGQKFAAASHHKLTIWDVATGAVVFDGNIPGLNTAFGIEFPAEDFVLIAKEYLVEFESGIKVWQYSKGGPVCRSGYAFYGAGNALVPLQIPHAEALRLLAQAKEQSDLFVVKKGTQVAIDVSAVPEPHRQEVETALKAQLDKAGCQAAAGPADVTVKATITGPKKDTISYFRLGDFDFNKYTSTITYEYNGKAIWNKSMTNVPGMLFEKRDKSYQQMIDEAGAKPNLHFYKTVTLPDYLQKPSQEAGRAGAIQTLGVSKITANGL